MSISRGERMSALARRMRAVFEVRWDAGVSAGDAFDAARDAIVRQLLLEVELAGEMTFHHFATNYLPPSVTPATIREGA